MMFPEEPVQLQFPTYDNIFTSNEVEHLFSLFESGFQADSNSGSEPSRAVYSVEERQRRRMISNRESARRSRWRKKRHLENLTNQANQLKAENRDVKNRLSLVLHQCYAAETGTDRLLTESLQLQQRLSGLCQILVNTQFQ